MANNYRPIALYVDTINLHKTLQQPQRCIPRSASSFSVMLAWSYTIFKSNIPPYRASADALITVHDYRVRDKTVEYRAKADNDHHTVR